MKAKKIFTLAMAAVLTLALLAGCGAAAPAADPTAAPATDATAIRGSRFRSARRSFRQRFHERLHLDGEGCQHPRRAVHERQPRRQRYL